MEDLLEVKPEGLFCKPGGFYIDAWKPVEHCIITHGHGDHAVPGHKQYICSANTSSVLQYRLGQEIVIRNLCFGERIRMQDSTVSLHPAGHILGSSQVRIEADGRVIVISGDYKRTADPTCEPFELQRCDIFVTESTFGLPIYNWEDPIITIQKIWEWWQENQEEGKASILFCYALGKAQRILSLLGQLTDQPIFCHGAILGISEIYKKCSVPLPKYLPVEDRAKGGYSGQLILAPPSAKGTLWMKRFLPCKTALASGWMQVRGIRRRKNLDRGFPLSDHADWRELLHTISETGAHTVLTTHGNAGVLARYLKEANINAYPLSGTELLAEGED